MCRSIANSPIDYKNEHIVIMSDINENLSDIQECNLVDNSVIFNGCIQHLHVSNPDYATHLDNMYTRNVFGISMCSRCLLL